jgi:hypothetical protein
VPEPDLQGLQSALAELREKTGEEVLFFFAGEAEWPEGTELDPETGRPYDPLIEPTTNKAPQPLFITCSVAFRPSYREDTDESRLGNLKVNQVLLSMSITEWDLVASAVSFNIKEDNYLIVKSTADGIGSDYRQLVWGERQGNPLEVPPPEEEPPEEEPPEEEGP